MNAHRLAASLVVPRAGLLALALALSALASSVGAQTPPLPGATGPRPILTRPFRPTLPSQLGGRPPVNNAQAPSVVVNGQPPATPPAVAAPPVPSHPAGIPQPPPTPPPALPPTTAPAVAGQNAPGGPGTPGHPSSLNTIAGTGTSIHEFDPGIEYQPLPPGARITFNLQDADLPDLIRAIGNITGRRFILPGKVRSIKTTIYSPTKVTPAEAYQAFLSVLEVNGMTVVPSGRYLKIEETAGSATQVVPTYSPGQGTPDDDRYITRIVRLRSIGAEDASNVLGHFKSHDGDITPYAATNTLMITDNAANIRRMMQILGELDVSSVGEQIWVEPVHYALASELANRISEILGEGGRSGGGAAAAAPHPPGAAASQPTSDIRLTRILADDRSNSVVIVATQRMYLRVLELLRRLDISIEGEGQVRVLRLQHGDAEEMATTLNAITGRGTTGAPGAPPAGGQGGAQGTARNNAVFEGAVRVTADKASNALVVTSSPRDYASLRRVIDELDRSRRQVFIEAVVMELSVNHSSKLGLNFHAAAPLDAAGDSLALGGFNALNSILLGQDALSGLALGIRGPALSGSQNILPGIGISIPAFGVTLNALNSSGDANVLSTPHIIATDNSPADINVGQNVPLQTNAGGGLSGLGGASGAAGAIPGLAGLGGLGLGGGFAAPRQDVGTKIHLVPHINDSNEIRMEIDEEISEVGASAGGTLGAVTINRRTAKTTVVVRDQNTIVIGGLIRSADTNTETRIPILGDIPIIGALFRQSARTTQRSNLLLFLTPYVIRDQSDLRRIFERKMRERQEFIDRYIVFSGEDYQPVIDYTRTNGVVEEIRESIRDLRTHAQFEAASRPRPPPPHVPSEAIELPPEARPSSFVPSSGSSGGAPANGGGDPGAWSPASPPAGNGSGPAPPDTPPPQGGTTMVLPVGPFGGGGPSAPFGGGGPSAPSAGPTPTFNPPVGMGVPGFVPGPITGPAVNSP